MTLCFFHFVVFISPGKTGGLCSLCRENIPVVPQKAVCLKFLNCWKCIGFKTMTKSATCGFWKKRNYFRCWGLICFYGLEFREANFSSSLFWCSRQAQCGNNWHLYLEIIFTLPFCCWILECQAFLCSSLCLRCPQWQQLNFWFYKVNTSWVSYECFHAKDASQLSLSQCFVVKLHCNQLTMNLDYSTTRTISTPLCFLCLCTCVYVYIVFSCFCLG